jgi:hypothetical protein
MQCNREAIGGIKETEEEEQVAEEDVDEGKNRFLKNCAGAAVNEVAAAATRISIGNG